MLENESGAAPGLEAQAGEGELVEAAPQRGQASEEAHWSEGLPEELRELAAGIESPADLAAALERGLGNVPLTAEDTLEVDIPELFSEDAAPGGLDWFRDLAAELKLSKAQATALANGVYEQVGRGLEVQRESTAKALKAEYGPNYESKMARAQDFAKRIDEASGGSFGRVLGRGLGNDPDFVRAMVAMGEQVSESAWPGGRSGGGNAAVSTEEFIAGIFNNK